MPAEINLHTFGSYIIHVISIVFAPQLFGCESYYEDAARHPTPKSDLRRQYTKSWESGKRYNKTKKL